jgi:hypothetical protein
MQVLLVSSTFALTVYIKNKKRYDMTIRGFKKDGDFVYVEWELAFIMEWENIVHAANALIDGMNNMTIFCGKNGESMRDITGLLTATNDQSNLIDIGMLNHEMDVVRIRGSISNMDLDVTLKTQADFMNVTFYDNGFFPEDYYVAMWWLYETFGKMMNTIELMGHVNNIIYKVSGDQ